MPASDAAETHRLKRGSDDMSSAGVINLLCECGTTLWCLGDTPDGQRPVAHVERLKREMSSGRHAYFICSDGPLAECPNCGALIELPDPQLMNWLPFVHPARFRQVLADLESRIPADVN
ncbi:MAG: hypothetical protein ACRDHL_09380 [Candidatus Promineifilaceae bacterium]